MEKESSKVVTLYARVSTLDQNCEVQLEDLRRHASKRFARCYEYTDAGVSGTQRHRPQLDALMRDARKRVFDVVLRFEWSAVQAWLGHRRREYEILPGEGLNER
jgi:predicted site-specific integrase-resolvase